MFYTHDLLYYKDALFDIATTLISHFDKNAQELINNDILIQNQLQKVNQMGNIY